MTTTTRRGGQDKGRSREESEHLDHSSATLQQQVLVPFAAIHSRDLLTRFIILSTII